MRCVGAVLCWIQQGWWAIHVHVVGLIEQLFPNRARLIDHRFENVNVLNTFVLGCVLLN